MRHLCGGDNARSRRLLLQRILLDGGELLLDGDLRRREALALVVVPVAVAMAVVVLARAALRARARRDRAAVLPVRDAQVRVLGLVLDALDRLDGVRDVREVDEGAVPDRGCSVRVQVDVLRYRIRTSPSKS